MKHNTMKRVLAATLSVLTVAAPMTANVGGILQEFAIVANAVDSYAFTFADTGVTAVEINGTSYSATLLNGSANIEEDAVVKISSATKLNIEWEGLLNDPDEPEIIERGSNGSYTYTFTMPDKEVNAENKMAALTFDDTVDDGEKDMTYKIFNAENPEEVAVEYADGEADAVVNDIAQGTKVVVTAKNPIEVHVTRDDKDVIIAKGTYKAASGITPAGYTCEFYVEDDAVTIKSVEHEHELTYTAPTTAAPNVLKATCTAPEKDVTNAVAAQLVGWTSTADADGKFPTFDPKGTKEYVDGENVEVYLERPDMDLLGYGGSDANPVAYSFDVKKDGKAYYDAGHNYFENRDYLKGEDNDELLDDLPNETGENKRQGIKIFSASATGTYSVTVYVWGTNNKAGAYALNYTFTIADKTVGAKDIQLFKVDGEDLQNSYADLLNEYADGEGAVEGVTYNEKKGIWEIALDEDEIETVDGEKYFKTSANVAIAGRIKIDGLNYGEDYRVFNSLVGKQLYQENELIIEVYNDNYGGSATKPATVKVKWMLVEENPASAILFDAERYEAIGANAENATSVEAYLRNHLWVQGNEIDATKATFQWLSEKEIEEDEGQQHLDIRHDGVPSEEGRYKVWLRYPGEEDDCDVATLVIDKSQYRFKFANSNEEITFGDYFEIGDYSLMDLNGKPVNLTIDPSTITYAVTGVGTDYDHDYSKNVGLLPANNGTHMEMNEETGVRNNVKDYYNIFVKASTTDGDAVSGYMTLRVNEKRITADMFDARDLIRDYKNGQEVYLDDYTNDNDNLFVVDSFDYIDTDGEKDSYVEEIPMSVIGGYYSAKDKGTYRARVADLNDANNYFSGYNLYVDWTVQGASAGLDPEFVANEDGTYGKVFNGGKIHVSVQREQGKINGFGLIYDKEGKLPAPDGEEDATAYARARKELVLNNGYPVSGQNNTTKSKTTYGANIKPINVETGVWVVAYATSPDGRTDYSEPMYLDLTTVTQNELQLGIADGTGANGNVIDDADYEDLKGNKYNVGPREIVDAETEKITRKYYVAATKNEIPAIDAADSTNSRTKLEPVRFGFVLDKTGKIAAPEYTANMNGEQRAEALNKATAAAAKTLLVDKGFVEGTANANNEFHGENAYGANVTPSSTFTGIWARAYVDFGDGLIVYTDPKYFEDFNTYFTNFYGVTFGSYVKTNGSENKNYTDADKLVFAVKPQFISINENAVFNGQYAGAGVVVDVNNKVTDANAFTTLLYGKGFGQGYETRENINVLDEATYLGNITPNSKTSNVYGRAFIKIDDNLTLYDAVTKTTLNDEIANQANGN